MVQERTTVAIQRFLDAIPGKAPVEPIIRELLDRAVSRLRVLCTSLLYRSYPRLTRPPLNLEADELLGGVVAGLIMAMQKVHPQNVRQFFGLATQQMRWQLNDLARLLDEKPRPAPLADSGIEAAPSSTGTGLSPNGRRMLAAIEMLPDDEREIFDLIRIQGLTYSEAAEIVDVSVKTVQRRLIRARLLLAEQLADLQPALTPKDLGSSRATNAP